MVNVRDKITKIKLNKLLEYSKNNKNHPEVQLNLLKDNITRFGFTTPLLISGSNEIIAGHGRYLAALQLGMKEVPCIVVDDLSPKEIKALRIADNRIAELGETDWLNLKEEYAILADDDDDLEFLTGYSANDIGLFKEEIIKEPKKEKEEGSPGMKYVVECPNCGESFKPAGNK